MSHRPWHPLLWYHLLLVSPLTSFTPATLTSFRYTYFRKLEFSGIKNFLRITLTFREKDVTIWEEINIYSFIKQIITDCLPCFQDKTHSTVVNKTGKVLTLVELYILLVEKKYETIILYFVMKEGKRMIDREGFCKKVTFELRWQWQGASYMRIYISHIPGKRCSKHFWKRTILSFSMAGLKEHPGNIYIFYSLPIMVWFISKETWDKN